MDRVYAGYRYTTESFHDNVDGCTGLSLHCEYDQRDYIIRKAKDVRPIGRVIYYHGLDKLDIELDTAIPLVVMKEFIQEAEERIQVK